MKSDVPTLLVDELPKDGYSLLLYVVTKNPSDYPGKFVVRRHAAGGRPCAVRIEAKPLIVAEDLAAARAALPRGLMQLLPSPGDDPVILETWV